MVTIELAAAETSLDTYLRLYAPGIYSRGVTPTWTTTTLGMPSFGNLEFTDRGLQRHLNRVNGL
ncbi:MAG: hypothetical protein IPK17_25975 [Chloroflexi bacterium]|uniref:hypothetical protein n=1 Tax=Candidatus Flexifilum breve TaxID=3140694 RepID=UPI0031359CDC|nr:hypothetical protein [Chloroflexota bacterium]